MVRKTTPEGPPIPSERAPRRVEVLRVEPLAADLVTVTVGGPALDGFAVLRGAQHLKIFLPVTGQLEPSLPVFGPDGPRFPVGEPRPVIRTYTPRRVDPETLELDMEMLVHEGGPAGRWAGAAKPGDRLAVAGPRGGYDIVPTAAHHLLAADESGLPALATLLERVPAGASVTVLAEAADENRRRPLPGAGPGSVVSRRWLFRGHRPAGELLAEAVEELGTLGGPLLPSGSVAWVACEASAVRRVRRRLLSVGFDRAAVSTRGYWRYGVADHPDHDDGEDPGSRVAERVRGLARGLRGLRAVPRGRSGGR